MVICLELMPLPPYHSCFINKIQISLTFLVLPPAYPGCPRKDAVKWMSVCLSCMASEIMTFGLVEMSII